MLLLIKKLLQKFRSNTFFQDKEDQASVYGHRNFTKLIHREPIIASTKLPPKRLSKPQKDDPETPSNKLRQASNESLSTDILIPPSESVKARLSSAKNVKITLSTNDLNEYPAEADEIYPKELRPLSSYKLEKLSDHLKCSVKKAAEDTNSCTLNDYCSDVMSSIKSSAFETDKHKEDYRNSKEEYEQLVKEIEDTDEMQKKLTQADFLRDIEIPEKELDLVNKIWKEEVVFQAQQNKRIGQNGDKRLETKEEKEKLLAALRAIDKGEDVAYHENCEKRNGRVEKSSGKNKLMNELFGDDIEN